MPKLSVIIPIYGVEKYIERCAKSLFEQTLDDIEFIFVNDCTQDMSIEILKTVIESYPNRKDQIRIIHHKTNKGLSRARETGVQAATGDYIAHCDSDDWIDLSMYETMYNNAIENNSDVVKCGHKIVNDNEILQVNNVYFKPCVFSNEVVIAWLLTSKGWNSIWDTMVKRSIYSNNCIKFTDIPMLEDMVVMAQVYSYARIITIVQQPYYNYYKNPMSICGKSSEEDYIRRAIQANSNLEQIFSFIKSLWGDKFYDEILVAKFVPKNILINIMNNKDNYNIWHQIYPEIKFSTYFTSKLSFIHKIRLLMVDLHIYPLYELLKRNLTYIISR